MQLLKRITFTLFCIAMLVLAMASLLDNLTGEPGTSETVYHSIPFAAMWGVLTVCALVYIFRRKLWKLPATMMIHLALALILLGALVTHIWGEQGRMHIRENESSDVIEHEDSNDQRLPFSVHLESFEIIYYQGTSSPKDYVSKIVFEDGSKEEKVTVSMNNIARYRNYRFYQSAYDDDLHGSILIVTRDPWGIGLTYSGYFMLLMGMLLFWLQPNSQYRHVLRLWREDRKTSANRIMRWLPYIIFTVVLIIVAVIMILRWSSVPLMPVLRSPLFPLHVSVIMISYILLAFIMANGFRAMFISRRKDGYELKALRLMRSSQLMLAPALFLLIAGIFIGAVWANVSWGRYWGWDSKEVWALITMMFYSLPLHQQSLRWFVHPRHFHGYCAFAFLLVLMTYFGVNYFLSGLHSYA